MTKRVTTAELAERMEHMERLLTQEAEHLKIDRNKIWLNVPAVAALVALILFVVFTYLTDKNKIERQFVDLTGSIARLTEAVRHNADTTYSPRDAAVDCMLMDIQNDGWTCPRATSMQQ